MAIRYISEFTNEIGTDFKIEILDNLHTGDATELVVSGQCTLRTVDGDYDQYKPIRAQELSVSFINFGDSLTLEDFVTEDERRFVVKLYHDGELTFVGFLVQDGIQELMVSYNSIISLTFTDGIAFLRNEELTSPLGLRPFGRERITTFLATILHKLNPDITAFRIYCSLHEVGDDPATTNVFHQKMLDWYTFEKDGGANVDCYEALEMIMSAFTCTFFQRSGVWNIVYYPDLVKFSTHLDPFTFTVDGNNVGVFQGARVQESYLQNIASDELIAPVNEDQISRALQAAGSVSVTFRHERPVDVPKNSKPEFGERNAIGDEGGLVKAYNLDYWELTEGQWYAAPYNPFPAAQIVYWQKVNNAEGYELERRMRIAPPPTNLEIAIVSRPIEVSVGESLTCTLANRYALAGNFSGFSVLCAVKLLGYDGNTYWLEPNGVGLGPWKEQSTITPAFQPYIFTGNGQRDVWQTYKQDSAPFPVDGRVFLYLAQNQSQGLTNYSYFKDVKIEVRTAEVSEEEFVKKRVADLTRQGFRSRKSRRRIKEEALRDFRDFIQLKVKGELYRYNTGQNFKLKEEQEIRIGVSAKRGIKGSLFRADSVTLCGSNFAHAYNAISGTFGQIAALNLAYYTTRNYRTIEGTFKGYNYGDAGNTALPRIASFHTLFKFSQYEAFTGFKWYALVNMEINFVTAIANLTFTETKNSSVLNGGTLTYESEFIYD